MINDYLNYPNIIHNYNVKNIIKFMIDFYFPNKFVMKYNYNSSLDDLPNIDNKKILKIFGQKFVENNENNCFLFINEKMLELKEYIDISDIYEYNDFDDLCDDGIFEDSLYEKENKKINDISYMFYEVTSLLSLSDDSTFDTINVNNMRYAFYGCKSLNNLNCISKWNTSNVFDISYMFYDCLSLKIFPDISQWNTTNLKHNDYMINNNISLKLLPNMSNVDIKSHINDTNNLIKSGRKNCLSNILVGIVIGSIIIWLILDSISSLIKILFSLFTPFILIYDSIKDYEGEIYINNPSYHNIFLEINNNIEFKDDKNNLKNLNILSSIIYVFLISSLFLRFLFKYIIFFVIFFILDILFAIIIYFDKNIIERLGISFKTFEKKLNTILNKKCVIMPSNFIEKLDYLDNILTFSFFYLIFALLAFCHYEKNNKKKSEKKREPVIEKKELYDVFD